MLLMGDLSRSVNQVAVHTNPSELVPLVENKYLVQGHVVSIIDGPVCGTGNPGHVLFWKAQSEEIVFRARRSFSATASAGSLLAGSAKKAGMFTCYGRIEIQDLQTRAK